MISGLLSVIALLLVVLVGVLIYMIRRGGHVVGDPTRLGYYRDLELLSEKGSYGKVYKAYNSKDKRWCVLKVLRDDKLNDREEVSRFFKESSLIGAIKERHEQAPIVGVYAKGTIKAEGVSRPFIEMEYVDGGDLEGYIRSQGRVAPECAERVVVQIVRALDAAHESKVIHRDLKPGNMLLSKGDLDKVVVCDFGVGKMIDVTSIQSGGFGTAHYMSPEQCNEGGRITPATDIYSLGVIFYELLTGHKLFTGDGSNIFTVVDQHRHKDPSALIREQIPERYQRLIAGMLAKDPTARPGLADITQSLSESARTVPGYKSAVPAKPAPTITATSTGSSSSGTGQYRRIFNRMDIKVVLAGIALLVMVPIVVLLLKGKTVGGANPPESTTTVPMTTVVTTSVPGTAVTTIPPTVRIGKKCPKCGAIYQDAGLKYCIKDGYRLKEVRIKPGEGEKISTSTSGASGDRVCPKCGVIYRDKDLKFCTKDGTQLIAVAATAPAPPPATK